MPIRILHLEDNPRDAEIIQHKLAAGGLDCDIVDVDNQAQFTAALESESFDLVLCDYNLPNYDGISALKLVREKHPETPVILISGSLGEEEAVKCLQAGATDYLLKQRLDRLPAAVKRALQQAAELRQRRQVEQKLAASERHLRAIFDTEPECVKLLAADGSLLEMNPAGLRILEANSLEQVKKHCFYPFVAEEHRAAFCKNVEQVFRGESGALEFQLTGLKGGRRWLETHATPLRDEHGQVTALLGITRDITERKQTEERLRQNEAKLANAQRMAKLGNWELDLGCVDDVGQVCNLSPDAVPPGNSDGLQSRPTVGQVCNLSPDAVPPGSSDGLQSRPTVEQVCNLSPDAGLQSRPTGSNRLHWSDEVFRIFGYQPGEIEVSNENFFRAVHPDDRPRIQAAMAKAVRERQPYNLIHRIIRPDGTQRIVQEQSEIQLEAQSGQPVRMIGTVQDITDLKQAEQALAESEFLYQSLVEHLPLSVFHKDREGRFTFANARFCAAIGKPLTEVLGQMDSDIAPPELVQKYRADDRQVMETGEVLEMVEENRSAGGKTRFLQVVKSPFRNAAGEIVGIQGIFTDITERRELEEQLRQSQKMYAIGQLAGGVAHDFNNLLTVIQGCSQLLLTQTNLPPDALEQIQQIHTAGERAADLTRQLLTFGRKQALTVRALDINESVRNITKMLQRIIGKDITLQCAFAPALPPILAYMGMMDQIILNLSINARDAMPKGGRLVVETSVVEVTAEAAQRNPNAHAGRHVCVRIADTGSGIAPEHLAHIFEPFFTTKEVGKGTGLGLATVFGIVQQHHGWMEVDSTVGIGTAFKVFLPATADAPTPAREVLRQVRGGKETILVVEDNEVLRHIMLIVLRKQGYRVLEAASGVKALAVWEEHATEIDLLLTDLMMPEGMNGRELAEQLQAQRPGLKIIYTSGYSPELAGPNLVLKEGLNFLQKPYPPPKLAQTVRDCLDD